jgi:hypothetical protein
MKLPDFKLTMSLNTLKDKMGIPRNVYGDLHIEISPESLTRTELTELGSRSGHVVEFDEIVLLPDGTLSYKGQRVVVYIRDREDYFGNYADPRFHLANCRTLIQMRRDNRFGKYVARNNTSHLFEMNIIHNGKARAVTKSLDVCQNCLDYLAFKNFSISQAPQTRGIAVSSFSLMEFFTKYPKTFHWSIPKHSAQTAPVNTYPPGFAETSANIREKAGWRCQNWSCGVDLSLPAHRKYLHAHHVNGEKYDESEENLQALCIYCHADMPRHHHLRNSQDYSEFLPIRSELLKYRS